MKNIINNIFAIAILLFSACTDLEEEPVGLLSPESFFQSPQDVEAAIFGGYAILTSEATYGRDLAYGLLYGSDYIEFGNQGNAQRQAFQNYSLDPFNVLNTRIWQAFYAAISASNAGINGAELIDTDEETRNRLIAEARFIRAFSYYNLVRLYGAVPYIDFFVTDPVVVKELDRLPVEEVYANIIEDLAFAKENLPPLQNLKARATSGSAGTVLADVYLTRGQYDLAAQEAQNIVDSAGDFGYSLDADYQALFDGSRQDGSPEPIFVVDFISDFPLNAAGTAGAFSGAFSPNRTFFPNFTGVRGAAPPTPSSGGATRGFLSQLVMTIEGYNEWDIQDYRTRVAVTDTVYDNNGNLSAWETEGSTPVFIGDTELSFPVPHMEKYWKFPGWDWGTERPIDERLTEQNFNIYRYADVLLIAAEALIRSSGDQALATSYINQLRARARNQNGIQSTIPEDLASVTVEDVLAERKLELSFEFKRFFDIQRLVRNGHNSLDDFFGPGSSEPLETIPDENRLFWPIPQVEIDAAGLIQNPGY
ncbi:MAG: RagB/SusD family nutrient uptake outer membrane protein [Bacteroidota bacterium]